MKVINISILELQLKHTEGKKRTEDSFILIKVWTDRRSPGWKTSPEPGAVGCSGDSK